MCNVLTGPCVFVSKKMVSASNFVSEFCLLYLADHTSCKKYSRACKYGRSNWPPFKKNSDEGAIWITFSGL